jgi:ATP-dependent protease HslVU (ClpYQ) peptidase subunit
MTTIIAIQQQDKVLFGADSQVTAGNGRIQRHREMIKISERGPFIIAGSGECAPCDIAQHIWNPPRPTNAEWKDLYHFMIAKVIPSLKAVFKENEYKWDTDDDETKFCFLIAIGGQVFEIADDMSVSLTDTGFYGVGSGSSYAIGALEAGASLSEALEIAAKNDAYTSAPFIYYTQPQQRKAKGRK